MVFPITNGNHKKLKPGLIASYDIWPEKERTYSGFGT